MTNEQLQRLKKYIKIEAIMKSLPVEIPNWKEKSAGNNGKSKGKYYKDRVFTNSELNIIHAALTAVAHTIIYDFKPDGDGTAT